MTILPISDGWQFRNVADSSWLPASVPGTVHTDLLQNGVIEDPFYRTNERDLQWIDKTDWEYRTAFEVTPDAFSKKNNRLVFKGLDTYADVYLNDQLLLKADNFFRSWEADAKPFLKEGTNQLRIYFHSPIKIGLEKLEALGYPLPASNDQSRIGGLGDKQVSIFTRKPGYHFGWDWGPRLVTSGIWQPIELHVWDDLHITDLFFQQISVSEDKAQLNARFEVESAGSFTTTFEVRDGNKTLLKTKAQVKPGIQEVVIPLTINRPKRWWTRELGEPFLYDLTGSVSIGKQIVDSKTHAVGLRTLRIVQKPHDKGSSFYVELNGVPVFAKGANYIPNDVFIPRVTDAQYEYLISSAVDAHMNMLRVWGGGFYEKDLFYDLCDRNGILVWQDFMFACSMYPGDTAFLENVRQEATENVRRLRNHPSIALWCGNNENDVAWAQYDENRGWGWKQQYNKTQRAEIWRAYEKVFHEMLPSVVEANAPGTFYWPSSPYEAPGKHSTDKSTSGDIHYWGVWHGGQPFSEFRNNIGRFMSEYGFQSFPEFNTVKKYTLPEDWDIESEVMASHQRSGIGNLRIRNYMAQHFHVPARFEDQLYVGQLLQAESIKEAIEAHRIAMPYCMGSLYWQINDCWPVASWSGMDYYQNWKALHYAVKKAFEPVLLAAQIDGDTVNVYGVSDLLKDQPADLQMELLDFEGNKLGSWDRRVTLAAQSTTRMSSMALNSVLSQTDSAKCVLRLHLSDEGKELASALVYFLPPKDLDLPEAPDVQVKSKRLGDSVQLVLSTGKLAKNVYLQWDGVEGFFSENYFDLLPGTEKTLTFTPKDKGLQPDADQLRIQSLVDTY
ncbi:MAG: glycoside hydrolase family 2 protein [Lewinellaceae bacterium]|nr:glycoside hydrolase family 2 protein [Lewinellaceae bacterium]